MSARTALIDAENALDQVELLFDRKRFQADPEVKVLGPVVSHALKTVRKEIAAEEIGRIQGGRK